MAADLRILNEHRIDVEKTCEHLGASGEPVSASSVYRAFEPGRLSVTGQLVQLGHLKINGKLMTSLEAIERYVAALNGVGAAAPIPKSRKSELESARRQCEAMAAV